MFCSYCGKSFFILNKFLFHLEFSHKINDCFVCPFKKCSRSFHRKDNFKKHIILNHTEELNKKLVDVQYTRDPNTENKVLQAALSTQPNEVQNEDLILPKMTFDLTNEVSKFNVELEKAVKQIISKLYTDTSVPRVYIQKIIENIQEFLQFGYFSLFKKIILHLICDNNNTKNTEVIDQMCDTIMNSFTKVDTDYKRMNHIKNTNYYIEPVSHTIGFSEDFHKRDRRTELILKKRTAIYVPIERTLKQFLEIPEVLDKIMCYHNETYTKKSFITSEDIEEQNLKNILDGTIWKNVLSRNKEKFVLPLTIYFDDFEVCNPLGSHAGIYKLGAVYYAISSVPPEFASKLENIFLALLFHSIERNKFGNEIVFTEFLNSLKSLENNGLEIKRDTGVIKVYFNVCLITGDNLGLHTMLGLGQSFSSGFCCRFCLSPKSVQEKQTELNYSDIRKANLYNDHLNQQKYNIKEKCIWNILESFHIYENHAADIMHDLYEGVYRYDMALIIKTLIDDKIFSLETLNEQINYFEYSDNEKNKPPPIKKDHLKKELITMSSSEMLTLVKNLKFFVGSLVPNNHRIWEFYLILIDITQLLTNSEITVEQTRNLRVLIPKYLKLRLFLFPENTLKPKHHLLLHYADIIEKVGPLVKISCLRFEAKHQSLKKIADSVETRKNIPLTIVKRIQIQFACRCQSQTGFTKTVNFGKEVVDLDFQLFVFNEKPNFNFFLNECLQVKWFEQNGIRYTRSQVLFYKNGDAFQFYIIKHVFIEKEVWQNCHVICEILDIVNFNQHFRSFQVHPKNIHECLSLATRFYGYPVQLRKNGELMLVSP